MWLVSILINIEFEGLVKLHSFGFAKGWFCVMGQNQMCAMCVGLKLFLKNVRWKKIKIQKRWLSGRLSDGSFLQSLVYVLFCRSFYALSSFRLAGNGLTAGAVAESKERKFIL
jgi:hypothetical protein